MLTQREQPTLGDRRDAAHLASIEAKIRALGPTKDAESRWSTTQTKPSHAHAASWLSFAESHDSKDAGLLAKLQKQLHHLTVEQDELKDSHYVELVFVATCLFLVLIFDCVLS